MRQFGLIGRTLKHSASEKYFTEKFAREHISDCQYSLYELPRIEDLPPLLERHPSIEGLNVTIPYKRAVIPFLDTLSYEAEMTGAVNCIRRESDGRWSGHNTDVIGIRETLDGLLGADEVEQALVLGTGGASQAVQFVLAERNIPYLILSRDPARGNYTYNNIPCDVVEESRLIINATPVGTFPDVDEAPRIPYAYVTPSHYLFDLVYNPSVTQFLDYGMQRGAKVINGERMLTVQAEASWRIWNSR